MARSRDLRPRATTPALWTRTRSSEGPSRGTPPMTSRTFSFGTPNTKTTHPIPPPLPYQNNETKQAEKKSGRNETTKSWLTLGITPHQTTEHHRAHPRDAKL